jgi:hypothetical protein
VLDACSEALHDLPNAPHLVELNLELIDLAQDLMEAGNLSVGRLDRVTRAGGLGGRCGLGLSSQLKQSQ